MQSLDSTTQEVQALFYQGAYQACIDFVRQNSSGRLNDPALQQRLFYGARSAIALNDTASALTLLPSASINTIEAQAVRHLAEFVAAQNNGNAAQADDRLADLRNDLDQVSLSDPAAQLVRVCVATAMARDGDPVSALEVLEIANAQSKELESIALGVHILLSINRIDLAKKVYNAARVWADDTLLIQLIEAYIGIYEGGRSAQQAYYVYDEFAQNPSQAGKPSAVVSMTGKAVARMVSGEYVEASSTLNQAQDLSASRNTEVLANKIPLSLVGNPVGQTAALQQAIAQLRAAAPGHAVLRDLQDKDRLFDEALAKHKELSAAT